MSEQKDCATKLADTLEDTGLVVVIRKSASADSVRLLCRVANKRAWCSLLEKLLQNQKGWEEHICQQYFLKDGKLVYGWNFIVTSKTLDKSVEDICQAVKSAVLVGEVPSTGSVDSMPLIGAGSYRNTKSVFDPRMPGPSRGGPSHKGAYPVGSER